MSLRPRYSLLTLLLFTACIAAGVKFWRGPHELILFDRPWAQNIDRPPPSPEEQRLLGMMPIHQDICGFSTIEYRLRFINTLERNVIESGKGTFREPTYLMVGDSRFVSETTPLDYAYVLPQQYFSDGFKIDYSNDQKMMQQIICFIFGNPEQFGKRLSFGHYFTFRLSANKTKEKTNEPIFFITTDKRIFQFQHQPLYHRTVRLVTLGQVDDPAIATRIAEELVAID